MDMVDHFPNPTFARTLRIGSILLLLFRLSGIAQDLERLRILQTADLHATVAYENPSRPGVLRLGTVMERLRSDHRFGSSLYIDCGDTCQGTSEAVATRGDIGVQILEGLGVDIWVPGNHEFDFGSRQFLRLTDAIRSKVLCGNLEIAIDAQLTAFPAWRIVEVGRARLAVLGFTAKHLSYWLAGGQIEGVRVRPALASLPAVLAQVAKKHPDMIVLAMHQGWLEKDPRGVNEVAQIVDRFPEIDLILGAHTHRTHPGRRVGLHTWYVQPGQRGQAVAVVDVTLDLARHRVVGLESHLALVEETTPQSEAMALALAPDLATTAAYGCRNVCELPARISATGTPGIDCAMSELFCRALSSAAGATVVFHGTLSEGSLGPGPISRADLFQVVPYENEIITARLTPDEINQLMNEQWQLRKRVSYNGIWGIHADIAESGDVIVKVPPELLQDGRVLVAFNGYTSAGGGGRFPVLRDILSRQASMRMSTGVNTRRALEDYLHAHGASPVSPQEWIHWPHGTPGLGPRR